MPEVTIDHHTTGNLNINGNPNSNGNLNSDQRLPLTSILLLIAMAALLLMPGMGVSLIDRDEGWYGQVVREMRATGDWLVPRRDGEVWLGKPPMLYWLAGLSTFVFGWGEWQLRLMPVLAGIVNTVLVAWFAARLFNRRVGLWAGAIFITFGLATIVSKMFLVDALLLTLILLAVMLQWKMATLGVTHLRAILFGIVIGLGILTKGPVIIIFSGPFAIALLVAYPRCWRRWLGDWRWWLWGGLFAFVVSAPWCIYLYHVDRNTFLSQFIGFEMTSRLASRTQGSVPGFPGFYLLAAVGCLLPWTVTIPGALRTAYRERRVDPAYPLLLIWLIIPWVFLEAISGKGFQYPLPCYVALAILLAAELVRRFENPIAWASLPRHTREVFRWTCWPMLSAGIVALLVGVWYFHHALSHPLLALGAVLVVSFGGALVLFQKVSLRAGCMAVIAATVATHATAGLRLTPVLDSFNFSRRTAEAINAETQPSEKVVLCGYKEPTLHFYTNERMEIVHPSMLTRFVDEARSGPPILLAVYGRELEDLEKKPATRQLIDTQLRPLFIRDRDVVGYTHVKRMRFDRQGFRWYLRPDRMYLARLGGTPTSLGTSTSTSTSAPASSDSQPSNK